MDSDAIRYSTSLRMRKKLHNCQVSKMKSELNIFFRGGRIPRYHHIYYFVINFYMLVQRIWRGVSTIAKLGWRWCRCTRSGLLDPCSPLQLKIIILRAGQTNWCTGVLHVSLWLVLGNYHAYVSWHLNELYMSFSPQFCVSCFYVVTIPLVLWLL